MIETRRAIILHGINYRSKVKALVSHENQIEKACEFMRTQDRTPIQHFREEFNEVVDFTDALNGVEELGDLIFTALHYVNSELAKRGEDPFTLSEVLAVNDWKLRRKKGVQTDSTS